ncbi:MAG: flagellar motor protein MotA, partial [Alphaproteobacteria bacterium]|nr:flagellar motor protein MotA [Alphaproteobacteria bacterium]
MNKHFHFVLNRMALFTTLVLALVLYFNAEFMQIATANIWLNGVIIGTTLFGIGLCFVQIFQLLPEYKWLYSYTTGRGGVVRMPNLLRPVAQILSSRPRKISESTLDSVSDMILLRFEDSRESVRYITNILIFLGLLGTFWG